MKVRVVVVAMVASASFLASGGVAQAMVVASGDIGVEVTAPVAVVVAPVADPAPVAQSPAPVESAQAVAPVAAKQEVAAVAKAAAKPAAVAADPAPAPVVADPSQTYPDGTAKFGTVTLDDGTVVAIPLRMKGNAPNIPGDYVANPAPTPAPSPLP
jgi:hypothetical protein